MDLVLVLVEATAKRMDLVFFVPQTLIVLLLMEEKLLDNPFATLLLDNVSLLSCAQITMESQPVPNPVQPLPYLIATQMEPASSVSQILIVVTQTVDLSQANKFVMF